MANDTSLKNFKEVEAVLVTFDEVDGNPTVVDMQRKLAN